jgi:hypothetical protein
VRLIERFRSGISKAIAAVVAEGLAEIRGGFLWPPGKSECPLRGPTADGETRLIEHVPEEEIAFGLRTVLAVDLRLPREALVKEVARLLGLRRPSEAVLARIDGILDALVRLGVVTDNAGIVSL